MQLNVRGKNLEVTEALRNYVHKRLGKIAKLLEGFADKADVILEVEKERHLVEVTVPLEGGFILRAETESPDMYGSIDGVVDKLERQISRFRARFRRRAGGRRTPASDGAPPLEEPVVVRRKGFSLKPMDLDEARLQMELLGHDFFLFLNAETDSVNLLYRRRDGNLGLLEPS
jgi:putative sigma-54 modulation protein